MSKKQTELTHAYLLECLHYELATGDFHWLSLPGKGGDPRIKVGDLAGRVDRRPDCGYRDIGLRGKKYKAQRLAWFYMTGKWPTGDVDHINRIRTDNRWANLRSTTRAQNLWNSKIQSRNTSGHKGVSWVPSRGKWVATICANGRQRNLGRFVDINDAIAAYAKATHEFHGEFTGETHSGSRNGGAG